MICEDREPRSVQVEAMDQASVPEFKRPGGNGLDSSDAKAWLQEGEGQEAAARSIWARWLRQKRRIRVDRPSMLRHAEWMALTGNPRASVLLMGYAVEMYLKAGLAKWLVGCEKALLDVDVRQYGHDYVRLASDLEIDEAVAPRDLLSFLKNAVTLEARYPAQPNPGETPIEAINRRTSNLWNEETFKEICRLAKRLRDHVKLMNSDRRSPASTQRFELPAGGYLVMRRGGHLPSRVTVRPPEGQAWGYSEITDALQRCPSFEVQQFWSQCEIHLVARRAGKRCDGSKKIYPPRSGA
ncbi:hypothetical protein [Xanthomonas citri]|uniref:hypothetical protein n=1 Tax=Xanthomonas citri TaxID=346 RepID=UPI000D655D5A|nr:hypothetical protein [Xanthomonas citri]MBD4616919.1 hypothetical protein [Xanthomonas citri pv. citri]MBD4624948.1 hypothetical protein [Xanthomonas citri pv. citri]MBD4658369.1 hypothetical protein [Xanthomonas citri pv. citri]MBD4665322.1 hypothetical protein [Xanthomonas citri pv. citri]MBD4886894.1 hypothetical protein [Xanthomonas citri pv. citri]